MSKKLLLADDSITIQKVIGITFANEEYALSVVDNGATALEKARAERPDLILADVFMPGKNGYELCAALKSDPALRSIPVLLLAGTFEPFDEAKARQAGADGWIAKPFESQALIDRVEDLLARPRPAVEVAPAPAPAAPVSVAPADAEPDLWAEIGPMTAPTLAAETVGAPEGLPQGSAGGVVDDLWGEVTLGEEDLAPVTQTPGRDIWDDLKTSAPPSPLAPASADIWEEPAARVEPKPTSAPPGQTEEEEVFLILEEEDVTDLLEVSEAEEEVEEAFAFVADEKLAEDLSTAAAMPVETAATFIAAEPGEEDLIELGDGDIMTLDDADILTMEELEPVQEVSADAVTPAPAPAAEFAPAQKGLDDLMRADPAGVGEEPEEDLVEIELEAEPEAGEPPLVTTEESFADLLFEDLALPSAGAAEPAAADEPASLLVDSQLEEAPIWDVVEPEPQVEEQTPASALPEAGPVAAAAPVVSAATVEEQVRGLSEAELSRIVERVAGEVIERLAGTILERLAWEVVPDLAESLIREEIRKIRDSVA